jgi:hypothetical protein
MAAKSKKKSSTSVTVSKEKIAKTSAGLEQAATAVAKRGISSVERGTSNLSNANQRGLDSRVALAQGAADVAQGEDRLAAANRADLLAGMVKQAGANDLGQGAEALATSEDIFVQSEIVNALSEADLLRGMDLSSIAGQLKTASHVVAAKGMPIMADFLNAKSSQLQELATLAIFRSGATRALANAIAESGSTVEQLGLIEVAEGATRVVLAEEASAMSQDLVEQGLDQIERGESQMEWAAAERADAGKQAVKSVAEIAKGTEAIGMATTLDATSVALGKRAKRTK